MRGESGGMYSFQSIINDDFQPKFILFLIIQWRRSEEKVVCLWKRTNWPLGWNIISQWLLSPLFSSIGKVGTYGVLVHLKSLSLRSPPSPMEKWRVTKYIPITHLKPAQWNVKAPINILGDTPLTLLVVCNFPLKDLS